MAEYSIEPFNSHDQPAGLQELLAVSQDQNVQMLPLTEADLAAHTVAYGAFLPDGSVVGYAALTHTYQQGKFVVGEVGGVMVHPNQRKHGIAANLIGAVTIAVVQKGMTPMAFCNPLSAGRFEANGYVRRADEAAPPEAFAFCSDCRKKPPTGCCDTVYFLPPDVTVDIRNH
jgi:N-acetylglutamate synthase-like GNAT family acetyltransferase